MKWWSNWNAEKTVVKGQLDLERVKTLAVFKRNDRVS